jgi:hypothetical protein
MGFPRHVPIVNNVIQKDKHRHRVICPGIAQSVGLRCSGRRNALGSIIGKRLDPYFSGTSAIKAKIFKSNTNVQVPYRVPITSKTHDSACTSKKCLSPKIRRRQFLVGQRAIKQMIGYFGGYISKKQKLGRFELKQSIAAQPFLHKRLMQKGKLSAGNQLAHVCNRMFTNLEGKGILRSGVEEYMLASQYSPFDELSAEFIRTFRHTFFFGKFYLDRYEALRTHKDPTIDKCLPKSLNQKGCRDVASLYGLRGTSPRLYYMSPWEFTQWWEPVQTKPPFGSYKHTMWLPDADYERAEPGLDYVIKPAKFDHDDIHVFPERPGAGLPYERFRNTWFLIRRLKPLVPCPENTPLPNSKMDSEDRSKIFSLYLRAWTLFEEDSSVEVPFITDLTLTAAQWTGKDTLTQPLAVYTSGSDGNTEDASQPKAYTFRRAWKDYLARVPPASFRQTRNFMMAVIAEGRNFDRDDTIANAKPRGAPVLCPLTVQEIQTLHDNHRKEAKTSQIPTKDEGENENTSAHRLQKTMATATAAARRVVDSQRQAAVHDVSETADKRNMRLADFRKDHNKEDMDLDMASSVETYRSDYREDYLQWKRSMYALKISPNEQQWQVLNLIHERCVYEHNEECLDCVNGTAEPDSWEPLFRLVHGLPGSGKSQLLKWITQYFEYVWKWENGVHFVLLAPLNSMATHIKGRTLHSWGGISFKKSSGLEVGSGVVRKGRDNISDMHVKCARLRFLFIDECECVGAKTFTDLEESIFNGVSTGNTYKLHTSERIKKYKTHRKFSGVNTFFFGDFYQLPPVGGTAVMSNPRSQTALEIASVQRTLDRFWSCFDDAHDFDALQVWSELSCATGCRVMDLNVNHRSGGDVWYSDLLSSCREGNMSLSDWQFLHGLPTNECGSWLVRQKISLCGNPQCTEFKEKTKAARRESPERWFDEAQKYECQVCVC